MSDLIERQAAIDALKDVSEHYTDKGREWHPHVYFMVEAIQDLPSAQPTAERVGHWVYKKIDEKTGIEYHEFCSECGFPRAQIYDKFCAVCGARMEG